eukprot:GHVT01042050.1.p1 GENE.GHVT01042050.1~~GHVT01042050.1.p1  ORF type:complete len:377 (+),score=68.82 GHVT01042050.1:482-1612(+)
MRRRFIFRAFPVCLGLGPPGALAAPQHSCAGRALSHYGGGLCGSAAEAAPSSFHHGRLLATARQRQSARTARAAADSSSPTVRLWQQGAQDCYPSGRPSALKPNQGVDCASGQLDFAAATDLDPFPLHAAAETYTTGVDRSPTHGATIPSSHPKAVAGRPLLRFSQGSQPRGFATAPAPFSSRSLSASAAPCSPSAASTCSSSPLPPPTSSLTPEPQTSDTPPTLPNLPGQYLMVFTCGKCNHRTSKRFSKHAYHRGVVIVQCPSCESRHLVADRLRWFGDDPMGLEEIMKEKGNLEAFIKIKSGWVTPQDSGSTDPLVCSDESSFSSVSQTALMGAAAAAASPTAVPSPPAPPVPASLLSMEGLDIDGLLGGSKD